jgi:hypothetical protein
LTRIPADADLVVIDETRWSTIPANKLAKAVAPGAHLPLVGT